MSAPVPAPLQGPAPTHAAHPPFPAPGPRPPRKGKVRAQAPPTPTPTEAEDPKYLIPFYNTKLSKAFGNPEKYTKMYPHSFEAGEFRRGAYDLASFTPSHLHLDNTTPTPTPRRPLAPARAAMTKRKSASSPPLHKLRVRWPPQIRRDLPPSQVPNDESLLLASLRPLTQTR